MAKRIALKDLIEVDHENISNLCKAIDFSSEHDEVDVSGFNEDGSDQSLAGKTAQSVTLDVFGSYGSNEIHQILYPLHRARTIFPFAWRPDSTLPVSATNPELRGNVQCLTYNPGATRGEAEAFQVKLSAADEDGLVFFYT